MRLPDSNRYFFQALASNTQAYDYERAPSKRKVVRTGMQWKGSLVRPYMLDVCNGSTL
jgi:hypothetical protein